MSIATVGMFIILFFKHGLVGRQLGMAQIVYAEIRCPVPKNHQMCGLLGHGPLFQTCVVDVCGA